MTCRSCESWIRFTHSGEYHLGCLDCCVRLVLSTQPVKAHAAAMLAAIERFRDAPARKEILARLRELKNRRIDESNGTECAG